MIRVGSLGGGPDLFVRDAFVQQADIAPDIAREDEDVLLDLADGAPQIR